MSSAQHPAAFMNLQNALSPFGRSQAPAFSNLMREQILPAGCGSQIVVLRTRNNRTTVQKPVPREHCAPRSDPRAINRSRGRFIARARRAVIS
jgi:hypothetical protein